MTVHRGGFFMYGGYSVSEIYVTDVMWNGDVCWDGMILVKLVDGWLRTVLMYIVNALLSGNKIAG